MNLNGCNLCDKIGDFFKSDIMLGFLIGVGVMVLLWLFFKCASVFSNKKKEITFEDNERGSFSLAIVALADFVKRVAAKYDMMLIEKVKVYDTRECTVMDIFVKAKSNTPLTEVRKQLRDELFAEMASKLGIVDQIGKINILVVSFFKEEEERA